MKAKKNFKKFLKEIFLVIALLTVAISIFYLSYSTNKSVHNSANLIFKNKVNKQNLYNNLSKKHIIVFNKPSISSKKILTIHDHLQLETVIPFYETDNWIKVGNIEDGRVGWINKIQLDKFYNYIKKNKIIDQYYEGEPKTSIKQSKDGKYIIKETNGIKDGVRYRITEEKFILDDSTPITIEEHENRPLYTHDISEQELQRALDELEYISKYD